MQMLIMSHGHLIFTKCFGNTHIRNKRMSSNNIYRHIYVHNHEGQAWRELWKKYKKNRHCEEWILKLPRHP